MIRNALAILASAILALGAAPQARATDATHFAAEDHAATNGLMAFHIASSSKTGKQRIERNTISGFAQGVAREEGN